MAGFGWPYFDPNTESLPSPRKTRWERGARKDCKDVRSQDILSRLRSRPPFPPMDNHLVSNRQTDVKEAAERCCLEPPFAMTNLPTEVYFPS